MKNLYISIDTYTYLRRMHRVDLADVQDLGSLVLLHIENGTHLFLLIMD